MKPAVLVVDMLKEFVYGKLRSPEAEKIVPAIKAIITKAREKRIPIVYLADHHFAFDREMRIWGYHALAESSESEVIDELKPEKGDIVLYKRSYSGFRDTGLSYVLRDLGVDTVILTGIHTHICVLHTAIDAFYERFDVVVVEDAVAAFSREDHEYALKYMKQVLGAKIANTREILDLFEKV
ncbi:MAG: cysteine hydrolase family protein [Desulfurococcaceae archaeon]|jgi:nicotinamidase-related amidase